MTKKVKCKECYYCSHDEIKEARVTDQHLTVGNCVQNLHETVDPEEERECPLYVHPDDLEIP